jgi:hypothetical protein
MEVRKAVATGPAASYAPRERRAGQVGLIEVAQRRLGHGSDKPEAAPVDRGAREREPLRAVALVAQPFLDAPCDDHELADAFTSDALRRRRRVRRIRRERLPLAG